MKKFLKIFVLTAALLSIVGGSTLWAQNFSYLESTGIYPDYRFETERFRKEYGRMPGEVIRLDVLFQQNVVLGDVDCVEWTNKTSRRSYKTKDFRTDEIWSCSPDYDCGPGSEELLVVKEKLYVGEWEVEVRYNKKSGFADRKQTFTFTASAADFVFPPAPSGCQLFWDGNLHVVCDAVLGPPTHPDFSSCSPETTPCVSYAVRIYNNAGTSIVEGEQPYRAFGATWDTGVYIPPLTGAIYGKVKFTIHPTDVALYWANKFRFEQRKEGVGGAAIGDPAFLVSRAALYDLLVPTIFASPPTTP